MTSVLNYTPSAAEEVDPITGLNREQFAAMQANEVYRPGQKDLLGRDGNDVKEVTWADKKWPNKMGRMVIEKRDEEGESGGYETWIMKTDGFGHPFSADDGPAEGYNCEFFMECSTADGGSEELCRERMYPILKELVERTIADPELPTFARKYGGGRAGGLPVELTQVGVKYGDDIRTHNDRKVGVMVGIPHTRGSYVNSAGKTIKLISVRLMKRSELLLARMGGEDRIRKVCSKFRADGSKWLTTF